MNALTRYGWLVLVAVGGILFYAARAVPPIGDPASPASMHVSPRYIEKGREETGASNLVTAVLADYRSYDTLGETVVILTAGLASLLVLGAFRSPGEDEVTSDQMAYSFGSDVLDAATRFLIPFILLFAFYVVAHGHTSPGGGFQGGAILAAALILIRLIRGRGIELGLGRALVLATLGVFVFAGIGVFSLFFGKNFLDYSALPLPLEGGHLREVGSLGIEVGVFLAVTAVLVLIFDSLTTGAEE